MTVGHRYSCVVKQWGNRALSLGKSVQREQGVDCQSGRKTAGRQKAQWRGWGGRPGGPARKAALTGPHGPPAMGVWCRSRIPVEGNFGQTYDSLNQSIRDLGGEFSATIDLKVGGREILWEEGRGNGA